MEQAMFSHSASGGEWEETPLAECLKLVEEGKAYECLDHDNYDDGLRNFHCCPPCSVCDGSSGAPPYDAATATGMYDREG